MGDHERRRDRYSPGKTRSTRKAPTPAEMRRLIEACGDDLDLATVVTLAALTGARRSELIGLRWSDVDWTTAVLTVHGAKGGRDRPIAIGTGVVALLARYRAAIEARAAGLAIDLPPGGWLLSCDCGRTPMKAEPAVRGGHQARPASRGAGRAARTPTFQRDADGWRRRRRAHRGGAAGTQARDAALRVLAHDPGRDRAAADMLEAKVLADVSLALPEP